MTGNKKTISIHGFADFLGFAFVFCADYFLIAFLFGEVQGLIIFKIVFIQCCSPPPRAKVLHI